MKNNCKISIVIPVYNAEKDIAQCLNSIINQKYKNLEIIIINDGSIDKSLKICKEFQEKDNRIIIVDKQNNGVSSARNKGIEIATGKYIGFVDSDDYIKEDYILNLYKNTDNENNDMIISGYTIFNENHQFHEVKADNSVLYNKSEFLKNFEKLKKKNLLNTPWNKLTKAIIVKKYKFNEKYINGEDYLFNLDLLHDCKNIKITDNCSYMYKDNKKGVTNKIKVSYTKHSELNNLLEMLELEEQKLLELGFSKEYVFSFISKKSFSLFKYAARNIAFSKISKSEKKNKYKALLEDKKMRILINKKNIVAKQDFIIVLIYKLKSVNLLQLYSILLKMKYRI